MKTDYGCKNTSRGTHTLTSKQKVRIKENFFVMCAILCVILRVFVRLFLGYTVK